MKFQRIISLARRVAVSSIAISMFAALAAVAPESAVADSTQSTAQTASTQTASSTHDVIAIAFQYNWNSVASECAQVYGPEGVGYVEVSPPQESITGSQWWTSYQPVSYKLDSKLGTEQDFKNMVQTCKTAGVQIIADAVINHTTGVDQGSGQGTAGSSYDANGNFPAVPYIEQNFHTCTTNVSDYTNAWQVQNCRLSGLQDLDTSQNYVQTKLADYLNSLLNLGVYGFRIDAAKHIATADLAAIKAKLAQESGRNADDIYFEQEVIDNSGEAQALQPSNYVANGSVSEFKYAYQLSTAFSGDISSTSNGLSNIGSTGWVDSSKASVFVTNWDTERNGSALTYKKGSKYLLANAFMLGYDYGQPHIYSGYYFDNKDSGAPGATTTSVPNVTCPSNGSMTSGTWQCAERWTAVKGMIGFHNAVAGTTVTNWKSYGSNLLGFSRGNKGYLALNNTAQDSTQTFTTSLPAGTYCNVYASGDCSQTVTVGADGAFTATIAKDSAIALYVGAAQSQWTGTQQSDPSDPSLSNYDTAGNPVSDTSRTIYYKLPQGWTKAYLHYGLDNWSKQGDALMQDAGDGWVSYTVDPQGASFEFVFTDGNGTWNNPSGGGNYTAQGHWTNVNDHVAAAGVPTDLQNYQPKTTVIVHYRKSANDTTNRGVYLWATDKNGNAINGAYHDFNGTDPYGQVFTTVLDGAFDSQA